VHHCTLQAIPVDYTCPPIHTCELPLLDANSRFALAINQIVDQHFPLHVSATLRQYRYYQEKRYYLQQEIKRCEERIRQDKEEEYQALEKAMCVLSTLENTNFLGHLYSYEDNILHALSTNPSIANQFLQLAVQFHGTITNSGTDATPNPLRTAKGKVRIFQQKQKQGKVLYMDDNDGIDFLRETADVIEDNLRRQIEARNDAGLPRHPRTFAKKIQCFKCRHYGHVRTHCPSERGLRFFEKQKRLAKL
jgi:hypothetical protein